MRRLAAVLLWAMLAFAAAFIPSPREALAREQRFQDIAVAQLSREAQQTLAAIKRGGPFSYDRDGVVFGNYEHLLPQRHRGFYREYTVPTPGVKNRGARRIIAGQHAEYYYSDDHYRSFKRIRE
ncbi:MAG: guanine-specific ribonuclease [Betaproteobacteria bacterium]|nr:guanine-specific ribonuclease [Betaproteobacteria bacterium]